MEKIKIEIPLRFSNELRRFGFQSTKPFLLLFSGLRKLKL